jgi:hypothetical protein
MSVDDDRKVLISVSDKKELNRARNLTLAAVWRTEMTIATAQITAGQYRFKIAQKHYQAACDDLPEDPFSSEHEEGRPKKRAKLSKKRSLKKAAASAIAGSVADQEKVRTDDA